MAQETKRNRGLSEDELNRLHRWAVDSLMAGAWQNWSLDYGKTNVGGGGPDKGEHRLDELENGRRWRGIPPVRRDNNFTRGESEVSDDRVFCKARYLSEEEVLSVYDGSRPDLISPVVKDVPVQVVRRYDQFGRYLGKEMKEVK